MDRASIVSFENPLGDGPHSKLWYVVVPMLLVILLFTGSKVLQQSIWKTYQDAIAKVSVKHPHNWSAFSDLGMLELSGNEGKIVMSYGNEAKLGSCESFGGTIQQVPVGESQLALCYKEFENSAVWLGSCTECTSHDSYSVSAQVNDSTPQSRETVLKILSTFIFTN